MHKTVLVTGPAVEPLEVAEVKTHLNVSGTSQDTYIDSLITTARGQVEKYLNRVLINQSWKVYYDHWHYELMIPFGNLSEVTTVKYYDLNGDLQPWATSNYWVVTTTDPGRIIRAYDVTFPELQYGRPDAIEIAFTAGYGADASAIPGEIKHAMKLLITNYYENRGDVVIGAGYTVGKIPSFVTDLLHPYKLYQF